MYSSFLDLQRVIVEERLIEFPKNTKQNFSDRIKRSCGQNQGIALKLIIPILSPKQPRDYLEYPKLLPAEHQYSL
jgi:hypothetical protein